MIDYRLLTQCPVFMGIPEKETEMLFKEIHVQLRTFVKGEIVVAAGQTVNNLFIILSGSVKGEMIDYSGKVIKIEDIEAPKPLASAFLFGKENKFPVTVTANTDGRMLVIPISEFLKLLQMNVQLLRNYLNSISTRAQFLSKKLRLLSFKSIKGKLAYYLLKEAGEDLHSIELKNTQQQLADLFGVTRPSLARVYSEMQKDGWIKVDKKTITLLDKNRLNELLQNG